MKIVHLEGSYQGQLEKEVDRLEAINKRLLEACKGLSKTILSYNRGEIDLSQLLNPFEQAIAKAEGREL